MNTFGNIFRLTSFGESHGEAVGGIIDGCPSGMQLDINFIQNELDRRRPGQSEITTQRVEKDIVHFVSGHLEGKTTGAPLSFMVKNENTRPEDYDKLKNIFRPSHADYTYSKKYGIRDYRGGGRSSARETISRVVAGAVAKQLLSYYDIKITGFTSQVGNIQLLENYTHYNLDNTEKNSIRCPDEKIAKQMMKYIEQIKSEGDTIGGVITCIIQNVPPGLGEPVFGKLQSALASAMLSINAAKGFEYGCGFDVSKKGSELNDPFIHQNDLVATLQNHSGGIQGGITNGQDIYFRVAFKPVSTIMKEQQTVDIHGNPTTMQAHGRHDPCVLPRAVPIVEAMAAMVVADYMMLAKAK